MSENKTGKYLKYALGEILLVVIGILIALQLNNASEQKTNRDHVENILKSVFYNLEGDMAHPILSYIGFCNYKDSLNTLVLNKALTYEDYELGGQGFRGLSRLLNYEFEPFQFENQAYERLVANIEIIPNEYIPIVEMLQDVYSKEVPVVNEVALEIKSFVDEIEDKYQTQYEWYSNTDGSHFSERINYLLNSPSHLNDVKRHQELIVHLKKHLLALKTNVSIAYSKIHQEIMFNEPFSEMVDRFSLPNEDELTEFTGLFEEVGDTNNSLLLRSKRYYLTSDIGDLKLIRSKEDKFVLSNSPETHYIEFTRDEQGNVSEATFFRINSVSDTVPTRHRKVN